MWIRMHEALPGGEAHTNQLLHHLALLAAWAVLHMALSEAM